MKRSWLEKVYFKKKTPDLLTKFKKQKNGKNISKVLIQERSVTINGFFSLKKKKISNKITLVDNKENYL